MYIPPPAAYTNSIHNTKCLRNNVKWLKSTYQMVMYRGK